MKAEPTFSLKDQLFNPERVAYFAGLIRAAYPEFDAPAYEKRVTDAFPELELKARIDHMTHCLKDALPADYAAAVQILVAALPPKLDPTKTDDDFGEFILAPFAHYVALYGCEADYLQLSLSALREMTQRFSVEDGIRYFINMFPDETMAFLQEGSVSDNYHMRRLSSEGTRPKLPWSQKLVIHHHMPLPILDALFADKTRYVTRSVANHLNDIAKIEPQLVIDTLARWQATNAQTPKEMAWITQHSLRTLVKQGNHAALDLMGYGEPADIAISDFETSTPMVNLGEAFLFTLNITSNKTQSLMIDYVMDFSAEGTRKAGRKVFKLKRVEAAAGQTIAIRKKHPMKLMTTRRLYAGTHKITLQVNGESFDSLQFDLVV